MHPTLEMPRLGHPQYRFGMGKEGKSKSGPPAVKQGDPVGTLGQTGNATGQPASEAHVHFEVRIDGNTENPGTVMNSVPK